MNFHPRHRKVIPITKLESERLLQAFPSDSLVIELGIEGLGTSKHEAKVYS
jgi:hypothetical protein